MILFATPDFGASATMAAYMFFGYCLIFLICGTFSLCGYLIRRRAKTRTGKRVGAAMVILFSLIPLGSCIVPDFKFRARYGSFPRLPNTSALKKGMTKEEVIKIAGKPHEIYPIYANDDQWNYYGDPFAASDLYIIFNKEGRFDYFFSH